MSDSKPKPDAQGRDQILDHKVLNQHNLTNVSAKSIVQNSVGTKILMPNLDQISSDNFWII